MGLPRVTALLVALFAAGTALARDDERAPPQVPAWAPRSVFAGIFLRGLPVPQLRLGWEAAVLDEPRDQVLVAFEGGGGYGVSPFPADAGERQNLEMTFFYEHTAMAGVAYRKDAESGLYWGFQILTGPAFYGARYANGPTERKIEGVVEGRLHIGAHLGPAAWGVSLGYSNLYDPPRKVAAAPYVGGFMLGLFSNWK